MKGDVFVILETMALFSRVLRRIRCSGQKICLMSMATTALKSHQKKSIHKIEVNKLNEINKLYHKPIMTPILVTPTWRGNSFLKNLLKSFEIENRYFVFPKTNLYILSCIKL